jgi:hypothetical protein
MTTVNKLTDDEFDYLRELCNTAKLAEKEQLDFLTHKAPGLTFYKKHGKGNMTLTPLSLKNKELINFLSSKTNLPKEDIVSLHFTEYEVGGETTDHRDSNSSNTFLFLLNSATKGGDLRVDNELLNFTKEGSWVGYDGGKLLHGVTKIEQGYRKVLVAWYGESKFKKVLI